MLTLFKPSCVNAKRVLKPINILPISLIRFSMQRIPHGVQPVCFPTFIGQLHSLCIFKIFQRGFFCSSITQAGNLVAHSSFGGGIAWGWRGKGLRCGVWRGQPRSQQGICVLHLPLQSEHSYCTLEQLSGVSSDGRMQMSCQMQHRNINVSSAPCYNKAVHSQLNMQPGWGIV